MKKIYKNFDDLMEHNKNAFSFLGRMSSKGILKAIWEARDVEVDQLREEIKGLTDKNSQLKGLKDKNDLALKEAKELHATAKKLKSSEVKIKKKNEDILKRAQLLRDDSVSDMEGATLAKRKAEELKLEADSMRSKYLQNKRDVEELVEYADKMKVYSEELQKKLDLKDEEITTVNNRVVELQEFALQSEIFDKSSKEEHSEMQLELKQVNGEITKWKNYSNELKEYVKSARENSKNSYRYAEKMRRELEKSNDRCHKVSSELSNLKDRGLKLDEKLVTLSKEKQNSITLNKQFKVALEYSEKEVIRAKMELKQIKEDLFVVKNESENYKASTRLAKKDSEKLAHELMQLTNSFKNIKLSIGDLQEEIGDSNFLYTSTDSVVGVANKRSQKERAGLLARQGLSLTI